MCYKYCKYKYSKKDLVPVNCTENMLVTLLEIKVKIIFFILCN